MISRFVFCIFLLVLTAALLPRALRVADCASRGTWAGFKSCAEKL